MALSKTLTANGSKGHHRFTLSVTESSTSGNSSFLSYSLQISPIQSGWDWNASGVNYSITIGSNTYTGPIYSYNGTSTTTIKSGSNLEIAHDSDGTKTINIGFSITDSTGYSFTPGSASASDTFTLTPLHKAPDITAMTITAENNAQLTGVSLPTGTIAQYLSNKQFTITATPYDSATITNYKIFHNNVQVGTSSTNKVTVNFANVGELQTTLSSGTYYVSLTVGVTDNKSGYSTKAFSFPVLKYTRPTIEKTTTTIKRKTGGGTTLTDNIVLLNFSGTFYKGNDVIGNNNTQQVQYKIWNTTEPSYSNVTSSTSGSGNVKNVSVSNYQISNIVYTSSYSYKIKIKDSFTNYDTTDFVKTDQVPTGVSVWTEHKDRVNFIKATINNEPILMPHSLFTNATGTSGAVTLSDSASNYDFLEIYYFENHASQGLTSRRIYDADGKTILLDSVAPDSTNVKIYISGTYYSISGTSISRSSSYSWAISSSPYAVGDTNQIYITKVIGYK